VPDHGFDGAAPSQEPCDGSGDAAPGTADEDLHILHVVATISTIDEGQVRSLIGQDFDLLQRFVQRVAVVGIAWSRRNALRIRLNWRAWA
jgi:hypothetical protein